MNNLAQNLLKIILPSEIVNQYKLKDIIDTDKYVELVLQENNLSPQGFQIGEIELLRYDTIQLLTFPLPGKQCRLKFRRKRWLIKETGKTVTNPIPDKQTGAKIPIEFGAYLIKPHILI